MVNQNEMYIKENQNLENTIKDLITENEELTSMNLSLREAVKKES